MAKQRRGYERRRSYEGGYSRALGGHVDLVGGIAFMVVAALVFLATGSDAPNPYDYYVRLASAFLSGHVSLAEGASWLTELVPKDGRFLVVYPPMPAILLTPLVAIYGADFAQQGASAIFGAVAVGFAFPIARRVSGSVVSAAILTAVFGFGTCLWWAAETGSVWTIAHAAALMFLTPAVLFALERRYPLAVGLLLGAAFLCRLPTALALPFFAAAYLGFPTPSELLRAIFNKENAGKLVLLAAGGAVGLGIFCLYNLVRFGSPLESGYALIPGVLDEPWYADGIFSLSYVPRNLYAMLLQSFKPSDAFPFVAHSAYGLSLLLTTPLVLRIAGADWRSPVVAWATLAAVAIAVPSLMHGNTGWMQFGYRFSLDYQPLALVLLASAIGRHPGKGTFALAALSVVSCAYGVLAFAGTVEF